ncbi:MAG: glutamate racemase [Bacteroidota bacterium]|nr:glutamate racemase [Bacteroidota bacterium]
MGASTPIGVFDSGYGGLTILKELEKRLPQYDFLYLGDNARTPYGTRSFETVYEYTLQCIQWLFSQGCPVIVVACNTASAKALRTIQQKDLPKYNDGKRVLGVIRPSAEIIGNFTKSRKIGILGTKGTVKSDSYLIEIKRTFPEIKVFQHACPLWVPLIENNEYKSKGADYFIKKDIEGLLKMSPGIDAILLACTHYPLLLKKIKKYLPKKIRIISQGTIIAKSFEDYLLRHPEIEKKCSKNSHLQFFTTDSTQDFDKHSITFFGKKVNSVHVDLNSGFIGNS